MGDPTVTFAINFDLANNPAWIDCNEFPLQDWFQGFRGVMHPGGTYENRADSLRERGLQAMGVYTWESQGYIYPRADWVQVHNEPGRNMSPADFVREYTTVRSVAENDLHMTPKWAFPGLHLGPPHDENWLTEVFQILEGGYRPDAIALHLYTLSPKQAQDYCDRMWNLFEVPIICTEWYRAASQGHHEFQCMLGGWGLDGQGARCGAWNSIFCLSDHMTFNTEGVRLGLINLDGEPKDEFYSLLSAPEYCRQ